ncbi:MAG: Uma2 family endonuclease [Aestuariivita sp.]|nr:Uma2 family endonuclease [Aestuariivita sp.]
MTTPLDPHHIVGSLGSHFWRLKVPPQLVPELASKFDWSQMGRRVMIDTMDGIILWMNPSSSHAGLASASDDIVSLAASLLKVKVNKKRDTRWKAPDDPQNVGMEADAAFYIGENASAYFTLLKQRGREAAEEFEAQTPPDLVVEVEVTHFDKNKPEKYTRLGAREMWRVNARKSDKQPQIEILDLQQPKEPIVIETSSVLNGLSSSILPQAFWLANTGDYTDLSALLRENFNKVSDYSLSELKPDKYDRNNPTELS